MDMTYILVIVVAMAISGIASFWLKRSFAKYSQIPARNGMTGAQIARAILNWHEIHDVSVEETPGKLSDHYDPQAKALRLSSENFRGNSIAALGVAAHEVGHAVQHAEKYAWLGFRSMVVPLVGISSKFSWILIMIGIFMGAGQATAGTEFGQPIALLGVGMFAVTTLFTFITLPVEFDASKRALAALESGQILDAEELTGAKRVLTAAASTYVAAAVGSALQLLYWLWRLGLIGGRSND